MKSNQKSIRVSDRVLKYIENYRGQSFNEKLENFVLDAEEHRQELVDQWNRIEAEIQRKREELRRMQKQAEDYRSMYAHLKPLLDALDKLVPKV